MRVMLMWLQQMYLYSHVAEPYGMTLGREPRSSTRDCVRDCHMSDSNGDIMPVSTHVIHQLLHAKLKPHGILTCCI